MKLYLVLEEGRYKFKDDQVPLELYRTVVTMAMFAMPKHPAVLRPVVNGQGCCVVRIREELIGATNSMRAESGVFAPQTGS